MAMVICRDLLTGFTHVYTHMQIVHPSFRFGQTDIFIARYKHCIQKTYSLHSATRQNVFYITHAIPYFKQEVIIHLRGH